MKKTLALALVAAMFSIPAFSQDQKTEQKTTTDQKAVPAQVQKDDQKTQKVNAAQDWENKIKTELNLTPEQVEKFNAMSKDFAAKKDEIAKDQTLNDDQRKEKKMALMKDKEAKLLEILTPDQQAKYKQLKADMEKKQKEQPVKQ
jgi:hypothetical protein